MPRIHGFYSETQKFLVLRQALTLKNILEFNYACKNICEFEAKNYYLFLGL